MYGIMKVGVTVAVSVGRAGNVGTVKAEGLLLAGDSISVRVDSEICEGLAYIMPVISNEANNIPTAMPKPI